MKLRDLPIGSKIKHSGTTFLGEPISFLVAHKTGNRVKLITEKIVATRAFDAKEPYNPKKERESYGNNRWKYSNLRHFLNSEGIYNFQRQHTYDAPPIKGNVDSGNNPYDGDFGFLSGFDKDFVDNILTTQNKVVVPEADGGGVEVVSDKVYLPSLTEVGAISAGDDAIDEGDKWDLFVAGNDGDPSRIAEITSSGSADSDASFSRQHYWWTRSSNYRFIDIGQGEVSSESDVVVIQKNGASTFVSRTPSSAYQAIGVRPALDLPGDLSVTKKDGSYTLSFGGAPTITVNTPQSQTVFENDSISIDGTALSETKGSVVIVKTKIADSRVINLATKVSDGKPFDFARTFLFKQGRVWQGNEPITSVLGDTSHKIEVWAEDDKGNKSKVEVRTFSTTANRPPIVKITKTPSLTNVTNSTPVEVAGTVSDPDGHDVTMTAKLNDSPQEEIAIAGGEWSYIIRPSDLKEGANEITIIARDEHGMSHTKTVRINNTIYKADMSHVPSVALFDVPLEGVESDGAVMWLRRQSDNTQFEARVATEGKREEDFHEMQKTSHVVGNTPRDQFAGQTGVKTNNVTIEVTATGNHSLLMIQGVVK